MKHHFKIPLHAPCLDQQDILAIHDIFEQEKFRSSEHTLENLWKSTFGLQHTVALQSGTAALDLALHILGISPGDYVLVPTHTYIATASPVIHRHAVPVLIDSEAATLNMSPAYAEEAIQYLTEKGHKPKALIVTHLYGLAAQIETLTDLGQKYNIPIIEDAAESVGTTVNNRLTGTFGYAGIWSFNINKTFTGLGGGALIVQNSSQADYVRKLASHARENRPYFFHKEAGYNYRIHPAASGLIEAQMQRFDKIILSKRKLHETYRKLLSHLPVKPVDECHGTQSNYWLNAFMLPSGIDSKEFVAFMHKRDIEVRHFWHPLHRMDLFVQYPYFGTGESEQFFRSGILLPSSPCLRSKDIETVVENIQAFFSK